MRDDPQTKTAFSDMLEGIFGIYNRECPEPNVMRLWFSLLADWELNQVSQAFTHYGMKEAKYPPTPAAIRQILMGNPEDDKRLGADEAWAQSLLSLDEAATVIWSQEMQQAFSACRPVLNMGDKIGARRAFIDAYERLVKEARQRGERVRYYPSLGTDQSGRYDALNQAVDRGLLPSDQIAGLLPPPAPAIEQTPEEQQEQIEKLRKLIADGIEEKQRKLAEKQNADAIRTAELKADHAKKVATLQQNKK